MKMLRADQLNGRKLKVGETSISVIKKIGEGGSAFVYVGRINSISKGNNITKIVPNFFESSSLSSRSFSGDVSYSYHDRSTIEKTSPIRLCKQTKEKKTRNISSRRNHVIKREKGNKVVLKTMLLGSICDYEKAKNEVRMLRLLKSHRNIVQILDAGEGPSPSLDNEFGMHFILLEHCQGGSLMNLIIKHRLKKEKQKELQQLHRERITSSLKPIQNTTSLLKRRGSRKSLFKQKKKQREQEIVDKLDQLSGGFLPLDDILAIFQQVCAAVSFLHDRFSISNDYLKNISPEEREKYRQPIIHRDLKPENILLIDSRKSKRTDQNHNVWHCKLCDFGSAVQGRLPLKSVENRSLAEVEIRKNTTQMYRAPEMIDLHMTDELNEKTDIWALGCTLYTTAFLENCFEENANLGILSGKFDIPNEHPYGHQGLVTLIKKMLVVNPKERVSITQVCESINALRKTKASPSSSNYSEESDIFTGAGTYSVNSLQNEHLGTSWDEQVKKAKKLDPTSAAARRKEMRLAATSSTESEEFYTHFDFLGQYEQDNYYPISNQVDSNSSLFQDCELNPYNHPYITNFDLSLLEKMESIQSLLSLEVSSTSSSASNDALDIQDPKEYANLSYDFGNILSNPSSVIVERDYALSMPRDFISRDKQADQSFKSLGRSSDVREYVVLDTEVSPWHGLLKKRKRN